MGKDLKGKLGIGICQIKNDVTKDFAGNFRTLKYRDHYESVCPCNG